MTGHRPFSELTKGFTPERRARVAEKAALLREAMTLEELRKARSLSQGVIAAALAVGQPAVAKLEKPADMRVSNLRRYIEALGGTRRRGRFARRHQPHLERVSFKFPPRPPRTGDAYLRMTPRTEMDIAVVGVGINLALDAGGVCTSARVSLGAVAPTVLLVKEAGAALLGTRLDAAALDALADAAAAACRPIDDKRGTREYRVKVAGVLARRAALLALERARQSA